MVSLLMPVKKKEEKKPSEVRVGLHCKHCLKNRDFYPLYKGLGKDKKKLGEVCQICHWVYVFTEDGSSIDRSKMIYITQADHGIPA